MQYKRTGLGQVFDKSSDLLRIAGIKFEFAEGFDRYTEGGQCHEAGYDAHMTGVAFAGFRHCFSSGEFDIDRYENFVF